MQKRSLWLAGLLPLILLLTVPFAARGVYASGLPAAAATPTGNGTPYTVKSGDTLWGIAGAHGIALGELIAANGPLDPRRLRPGQVILVPGSATTGAQDPAQPSQADSPSAPASTPAPLALGQGHAALLSLMNEQRAAQGLRALAWSDALAAAAQAHAEDCARRNSGSHVGSDGSLLRARLARAGYDARWAGENWAYTQSVRHAFRMWWNEPPGDDPHRRNILESRATEIGIGIAAGPWGYYFVADFGGR